MVDERMELILKRVKIALGSRSYTIHIGRGILESVGQLAKTASGKATGAMVVTNPVVGGLYGRKVLDSFCRAGMEAGLAEIPDGEEYKALSTAEILYDRAYALGLDRQSLVVALGGGVVGDIAGFVAATYFRGVPYVQVPTTLLAQVDSSVGGKVAVNHPGGKNIIGAFYQPVAVFADMDTLLSLPEREKRAGLGEVIKHGMIDSPGFFEWLEDNMEGLVAGKTEALAKVVEESCRIKAAVVEEDERETGRRAILNFGHTVGHAVESATGYGVFRHGEAVSVGMSAAARIAERMGLLKAPAVNRLTSLLTRAGLPVDVPPGLDPDSLLDLMRKDKKAVSSRLTFVLPVAIGKVEVFKDLDPALVKKCLC